MGFKMPHALVIVAIACAGLGALLQVVGVATQGWLTGERPGYRSYDISMGLFKICIGERCQDIASDGYIVACRAFGILALLALGGCAAIGLLSSFVESKRFLVFGAVFLGFCAGLCCAVEVGVFAANTVMGPYLDYNYSFALTIVAGILGIAAAVCHLIGGNKG